MAFRLLLERDRDQQMILVRLQVDAGPPHDWVTIDDWTHPTPSRFTAKNRQILIDQICTDHDLQTTGEPGGEKDATTVPVRPTDWHRVLAAATNRRAAQRAASDAADLAWQSVVADTPRQGEPGYVGAIEIAELAGMTRYRVYQIQGVGKKPGRKPVPSRD